MAGFLAAGFLAAGFLAAGFLAAGFLVAGFLAAGFLVAGFLAAGFLAAGFLVAGFLVADFLVADFFKPSPPTILHPVKSTSTKLESSLNARGNGFSSGEYPVEIGAAAYFNSEFGINSLVLLKKRNKSADFPSG